jgi:hypothetical protein
LYLLFFLQTACVGKQRLKAVLVLFHGTGASAGGELEEGRRSKGRAKTHVEEVLEACPRRPPLILLEL